MMAERIKCLVVGAGPVGALAAIYAARRGWEVEVCDLRGDLRDAATTPLNFTKSINLALSERGINAMRSSGAEGLLEAVLDDTIPMYGRMIHGEDGKGALQESAQQYDVHGQFLRAVDRGALNKMLLDHLEKLPNVKLLFHHKLTGADFNKQKAWFELRDPKIQDQDRPREVEVSFDFMLGCDGAHSAVRYHMMKFVRMNYMQDYIDTLWCEFTIPAKDENPTDEETKSTGTTPSAKDGFRTSPNHLHIWPGSDKMFIAIPSIDRTFTCTLFAPSATFANLESNSNTVESFFRAHFPGAADLIGPNLTSQFKTNPHLPLINIKCRPHVFSSTAVILGDAAHAMVPFYGQGMNAGLEDVRVLFSHLDRHASDPSGREEALRAYSSERVPDAHAIGDLSMQNYWEMHAGVQSRAYLLRKKVEEWLEARVPQRGWKTQYSRVSFSNERYSEVVRSVAEQGRILGRWLTLGTGVGVGGLVWVMWLLVRLRRRGGRVEGVWEVVNRAVDRVFGR